MGRCGGWIKGIALLLVALSISCGNTGSKSSGTGKVFVFLARARLNLVAQVAPNDAKFLYITATLLDPQGNPFRNQRVTFEAEFADAIFIPLNATETQALACLDQSGVGNATRCTNRGAAITDDNGQAKVTLFAIVSPPNAPSNPGRLMRVIAEAPNSLDVATAISVPFTAIGFLIGGDLSITPPAVTFVNPLVQPGTDGPNVTVTVQGGRPPYTADNQNNDLGKLTPASTSTVNQQFVYTIIGAIPTTTAGTLTDTITVTDALGKTITATVTVIFADCTLRLSASTVNFGGARAGDSFDIKTINGVAPFTATHTFPDAGIISIDQTTGVVTFIIANPPVAVAPDTITIRDSRGCVGSVNVTITPATPQTILLTANPTAICSTIGGNSTITALALDNANKPFDGVSLLFNSTQGTFTQGTSTPSIVATTDSTGKATVTLTIPAGTPAGAAMVTATVGAITSNTATVNILATGAGTPPCP